MATGLATIRGRALAQGPGKTPRVGYVGGTIGSSEIFLKTLQELGHVQGRNVYLDVVILPPEPRRYSEAIAKFVAQGMDVIVASNPYALEAAVKATQNIPVVGLDLESDPVAKGWWRAWPIRVATSPESSSTFRSSAASSSSSCVRWCR